MVSVFTDSRAGSAVISILQNVPGEGTPLFSYDIVDEDDSPLLQVRDLCTIAVSDAVSVSLAIEHNHVVDTVQTALI